VRIKWPLAVALQERHAMVVRYSTIPLSPLALRHSTINMRLSLVSRAMGRAYLAFCSAEEQQATLQALAHSSDPEDYLARDTERVRELLDGVQTARYAIRDPSVWPASNTLAVPVFNRDGVAASMGMTFFSSAMTAAQAVDKYLGELRSAADRISERLQALPAHEAA
jgi:IclR family mhp operon transcriptional activator